MWKAWVGALLVVGVSACGSSGGGSAPVPVQKCEAFGEQFCDRAATCIVQENVDPGASQADEKSACSTGFEQTLDCSNAIDVGATYDACIAQVNTMDCAQYAGGATPAVPADCKGVILLSK